MKVKNKIVWVTGASSGIGAALVKRLAHQGAIVVLSARRLEKLKEVRDEAGLLESNSMILPLDLEDLSLVDEKVDQVVAKFGRIDILINNGGVSQKSRALETKDDIDRKLMEVNFWGGVFLTKAVAKQMRVQREGHVVAIASILGKFGLPLLGTYAAAKHAIYGWYESLRYELKQDGIKVTIISPGFINTEVTYKSLTEDGSSLNQNSIAQEKGMSATKCARKVVSAIENDRWHKYIGGVEIFMPLVKWFLPRPFAWLMTRLSKPN